MNTKKSSLSKVLTLVGNDFKGYWVVAALEFAILFFSSCSVILLNEEKLSPLKTTVEGILQPNSFIAGFISIIFPMITAIVVFGYLHRIASVTATHSLPISRKEHFVGHFLSGYLLTTLPIILNGIILAIIISAKGMPSGLAVVKLVLLMMLMSLVTYAFSVLAGMLVGTVGNHVFGAITANLTVPAIILVISSNFEILIKGYCSPEWSERVMGLFLPIMRIAEAKVFLIVWYIAFSLILSIISIIAYKKRPLENATDGLIFRVIEPLIAGFYTFVMASAFGEMFKSIGGYGDTDRYFIGFAIGAILWYITIMMMCEKTVKIFNKRNIRNAVISFCIMGLLLVGAKFDITGYAKKIPEMRDIKSVEITDLDSSGPLANMMDRIAWANEVSKVNLESQEDIALMRDIHAQMIDTEERKADSYIFIFGIKYNLKNGTHLNREYCIHTKKANKITELAKLYDSKEFKEKYCYNIDKSYIKNKIEYIEFSTADEEEYKNVDLEKVDKIFNALDADFVNRNYKEEEKLEHFATISFGTNGAWGGYYSFPICKTDKNTIAELKRQGLIK